MLFRSFPKLLRHPSIGRGSGNADMNHSPCLEFDDEEGKEGAKEEIRHLQEVTRPDVLGMVVQECPPLLPPWQRSVSRAPVLLDGPLADAKAQFQQFCANPLRTEDGDFSPPSSFLKAMVSGDILGLDKE